MKTVGSVDSVLEMLREEVEAEAARIRRESEDEERRLREAAAAGRLEIPDREERLAQERRRAFERIAREDWEDRRRALERLEAFVAETEKRGVAALAIPGEPAETRALLARLVAEAVARLPGDSFEVSFAGDDAGVTEADVERLLAVSDRPGARRIRFAAERVAGSGGVLVRTADGRSSYDNRFEARRDRFEAEWRCAVAEIHGP